MTPRRFTLATLAVVFALSPRARAQSADTPWPGARCYAITRDPWIDRDGRAPGSRSDTLQTPDLLILDSARMEQPAAWEPDSTQRRVIGRTGDTRSSAGDQDWDEMYTSWTQVRQDSVSVHLGSGFVGLSFVFRLVSDIGVGMVETETDALGAPTYHANVIGSRVTCPAAPIAVGRLRLAASEVSGRDGRAVLRLTLATEREFGCGYRIVYVGQELGDSLEMFPRWISPPRAACRSDIHAPATTTLDVAAKGRYIYYLIQHGDTNRVVLSVTDSTLSLSPERSSFVRIVQPVVRRRLRAMPR